MVQGQEQVRRGRGSGTQGKGRPCLQEQRGHRSSWVGVEVGACRDVVWSVPLSSGVGVSDRRDGEKQVSLRQT